MYVYMYVCMYVCMYNFYLNKLFKLHIHSLKRDYHDNKHSYQAYTEYV